MLPLHYRFVPLLIIGLVLCGVWFGIVRPSIDGLLSYRTLVGNAEALVALYDSIIADRRRKNTPSASAVIFNSGIFWQSHSSTETGELLHSKIKRIVDNLSVTLLRIKVEEPRTLRGGRVTELSFIITYEVQAPEFGNVVYAIESARPSIFIEWMEVSRQGDSLVVQMEVCGLTWAL